MKPIVRLAIAAAVIGAAVPSQSLVLWNTLDSDAAALSSVVGPPLTFFTGGAPYPSVIGTRTYVPGVAGNALTLGPAPYLAGVRAQVLTLMNPGAVLNPERGTIEAWYLTREESMPYYNNSHCMFGSMRECGFEAGIVLATSNVSGAPQGTRLYFMIEACGTPVDVYSLFDGAQGFAIGGLTNRWLHVAACWDRLGIAGTQHTMRLYLNGRVVAVSMDPSWGHQFGWGATVGGASDSHIARKFLVDELKLWDGAKTQFGLDLGLYAAQLDGAGSAILVNCTGKPGWKYFTAITGDPANGGAGLGTGPWGGLHISPGELLLEWSTQQPPFVGFLDAWGDSSFVLPAGTLNALSGVDLYLVSHMLNPWGGVEEASAPVHIRLN